MSHDQNRDRRNDDSLDRDLKAAIHTTLGYDRTDIGAEPHQQLRTLLEAEMAAEQTHQTGTADADRTRVGRRRRWWWWAPVTAVAATIAVALGVSAIVNIRDTDTGAAGQDDTQPESVRDLLRHAADQLEADGGQVVVPADDQWLYRRVALIGGDQTLVEETQDTWVSFGDGSTDPAAAFVSEYFAGPGEIHRIYRDLPDDTADLVDQIYELGERVSLDAGILTTSSVDPYVLNQPWARHLQAFVIVGDLLIHGDPPPVVQAKLYRALAEIPGIVDDGLLDDAIDERLTDGENQRFHVIRWGWDFEAIDWPDGAEYRVDWELAGHRQIAMDPDTYHFRALRWHRENVVDEAYELGALNVIFAAAIVDDRGQMP